MTKEQEAAVKSAKDAVTATEAFAAMYDKPDTILTYDAIMKCARQLEGQANKIGAINTDPDHEKPAAP